MTKYQFRAVMAVLWLIAANTSPDKVAALVCLVFFSVFSVGLLLAKTEHVKGGGRG